MGSNGHHHKVTFGALLVTLGIIYGDIGTSPLYVMKAVVGEGNKIDPLIVLGGISCIFWTLTLQTTVKYVLLALQADNKGEGGIFSLYTLVKRTKRKWLIIPAIIGGSALLADGIITPPISVSSAIEGLQGIPGLGKIDNSVIVGIVIAILTVLFGIQQFGTKLVGRFFGPVMLIWFTMLAILGIYQMSGNFGVLKALNPYYAYNLLVNTDNGFWLLGAVFLCTTGAEALYSDLGHCGKGNIRLTWIGVKIALILNYMGQGAFLLSNSGKVMDQNPFYGVMPEWFLIAGIIIATSATIVASQALISASFTVINEAMRLNLWPKVKVKYPTDLKGQLYIPSINWILWGGCVMVMLIFRKSSNMEAAYGLTINIDMLMTSTLLVFFMFLKRFNPALIIGFILVYGAIELSFLAANLTKFQHGGWFSFLVSLAGIYIMFIMYFAKKIRHRFIDFVKIDEYLPVLQDLSNDNAVPKYATHLVYLTGANRVDEIEKKVIYSILQNRPKRADVYWFVHVDVVDEPYRMDYRVTHLRENDIVRIDFMLGFRIAPRINLLFQEVVKDLMEKNELDMTSRYESLHKKHVIGDFRFIVIEKIISNDNEFPVLDKITLDVYDFIKKFSLNEAKAFGLDESNVIVEKYPIVVSPIKNVNLRRLE